MKRVAVAVLILLLTAGGCGPGRPPPTVESFDASPPTISAGASSTLSWKVSGATTVEIDHGIGSVALSGDRVVSPTVTTVYTLVATSADGLSVTATAQVIVSGATPSPAGVPVVDSFVANPPGISAGGSATLSWEVSDATSVAIDPGLGTVALSGSMTVSPTATTTYILMATNAAGKSTATARVEVTGATPGGPPVIDHFTATPPSMHPGDSSTLSWQVSDATSVSLDRGIGAVASSGTRTVSVLATTNYTLTAFNSAGSVVMTIPVLVTEAPPPGDEPDLVVVDIARVAGTSGNVVSYTIRNQGDATCPPTVAKLYVNGVYKASDSVPALPGASAVERRFTTWTFNPDTPVIKVVVDANDAVSEANEANNEKTVTIAVETVVNFIDTAGLADWETGSPLSVIGFSGSLSDPNGFACYRTSVKLEDGDTYAKVLETHPKWVNSGWISGYYPETTIPMGAKFVAEVGFLDGAAGTDGVKFRVWFWQTGVDIPNLLASVDATYDGDLDYFNIDLLPIVGRTGRIGFQILAGPSSGKDWAIWSSAKMIR